MKHRAPSSNSPSNENFLERLSPIMTYLLSFMAMN